LSKITRLVHNNADGAKKLPHRHELAGEVLPSHENSEDWLKSSVAQEIWKLLKVYSRSIAFSMSICVFGFVIFYMLEVPKYRVSALIGVTPKRVHTSVTQSLGYLVNSEDETLDQINTLIGYSKTPEVTRQVTQNVKLKDHQPFLIKSRLQMYLSRHGRIADNKNGASWFQAGQEITDLVTFNVVPNVSGRAVIIEATSSNPELATLAANETAKLLVEFNHAVDVKTIVETKDLLKKQESDLGAKLQVMESELAQFQSKNQILRSDDAQTMSFQDLEKAKGDLRETEQKIEFNFKSITQVRDEIKNIEINASKGSSGMGWDAYISQLQNRLGLLQYQVALVKDKTEKAKLLNEYATVARNYNQALSSHDRTKFITSNPLEYINTLRESVKKTERENHQLLIRKDILQRNLNKSYVDLSKLAKTSQTLAQLKRNVDLTNELYISLKKKIQEVEVEEMGTVDTLSITSAANPSQAGQVSFLLSCGFAMAVGLFGGLVIVVLKENLVKVVRGREDLENESMNYLASIPQSKMSKANFAKSPNQDMSSNIYRLMRLKIVSYLTATYPEKYTKTILITSPSPGDGKSFISANFATAMARSRYNVLLINLDLHIFKSKAIPMDQAVAANDRINIKGIELKRSLSTVADKYDRMSFELPEDVDPADMLEGTPISHLLINTSKEYDYIIVDSPPIVGIIDPVLLAPEADLVLVIVRHRKTSLENLSLAVTELQDATKTPLFGIINMVHQEFSNDKATRYYYSKNRQKY
jgi:succinoglycan biosynthesis transport protein ExoP